MDASVGVLSVKELDIDVTSISKCKSSEQGLGLGEDFSDVDAIASCICEDRKNFVRLELSTKCPKHSSSCRTKRLEVGLSCSWQVDDQATGDVSGFDLVYISESVNPDRLGNKFLNAPVPLISSDAYSYDDLGLTQTNRGKDYGIWGQQKVYVVNAGHPLTQGLSSQTPNVYNGSQQMHWGRPGTEAEIIAKYSSKGNETKATVFTYDKGSRLANGDITDHKRVALFGNSGHELTDDGLLLFTNAIKWSLSE